MKTVWLKFMLCRAYQSEIARQRAIKVIQKEHGYNLFYCAQGRWQDPKGLRLQYFLAFTYDAETPNTVWVANHPVFTWNPTNEAGAMKVMFHHPAVVIDLDVEESNE